MNHFLYYIKNHATRKILRDHAEVFLDGSMCQYEFLQFLPSVQAMAAILCAFENL